EGLVQDVAGARTEREAREVRGNVADAESLREQDDHREPEQRVEAAHRDEAKQLAPHGRRAVTQYCAPSGSQRKRSSSGRSRFSAAGKKTRKSMRMPVKSWAASIARQRPARMRIAFSSSGQVRTARTVS